MTRLWTLLPAVALVIAPVAASAQPTDPGGSTDLGVNQLLTDCLTKASYGTAGSDPFCRALGYALIKDRISGGGSRALPAPPTETTPAPEPTEPPYPEG